MKKMNFFKVLFIVTALILCWGLIWSWFVTRTVKKNSKDSSMKHQHAIVKNIIVTETKDEKKYWEFYAKAGEYDSEYNSVKLYDVIGNFYNKEGEVIVSFKSNKGTYDEQSKKVELNGDNLFVGKDNSELYADKLIWQGEDKDILAFGNVQYIHKDKVITKADRAVFNSALTNFKVIGKTKTKLYSDKDTKKKYTQL